MWYEKNLDFFFYQFGFFSNFTFFVLGMVEDAGQLDVKICGDKSCCFTQHLNNADTNFRPGKLDIFSGPGSIFECNNFEISDTPVERLGLGPVEMTVFHEGTDGIQLDYIGIQTDER